MLLLALLVLLMTLITSVPGLHAICDDYYYYERIARNLLSARGSTFDGVVPTNGYQPLWMIFVMLAVLIEHLTTIKALCVVLAQCAVLSCLAVIVLGRELSRSDTFGSTCLAAFAAYAVFLAVLGMEVSLLLLLGSLYLARQRTLRHTGDGVSGILLGLCFLTRIDAPVYFLPGVIYALTRGSWQSNLRFLLPLGLAIVAYCSGNYFVFGVYVPISGMAKSVTRIRFMHPATWESLLLGAESQLLILATCLLTVWATVAGNIERRRLALLSFGGALLFYVTTSLRSDWMIWPWYEYPLALHVASLATLGPLGRLPRFATGLGLASIGSVVLALLLVVPRNAHEAARESSMVRAALELRSRLADQPEAVLAMGDRAGAVGEYLPNRVVQLEGLVMDKRFLDSLHTAHSILPLLRQYGVTYYIATNPRLRDDGCFATVEPAQSKGDSPRVETTICGGVAHEFWVDGWHTVVFRIG